MTGAEPQRVPAGVKAAIAAVVVYLAATAFVGVRNYRIAHADQPDWIAARDLPRNHRIVAADLVLPPGIKGTPQEWRLLPAVSLEGRYLSAKVAKGQSIALPGTLAEPDISTSAGFTTVPVPIPASLPSNAVDAETVVDVISDGKAIAIQRRVVAVRCTATPPCSALVRLPQAVAARLGKELSLTVVAEAGEGTMSKREWTKIAELDIPSRPAGIWTLAVEYVSADTVLKLEASGSWQYGTGPTQTCAPDGDPKATATAPFEGALLGALIGRFGGSTATTVTKEGPFAVGSLAIVTATVAGPLYLTINQKPVEFPTEAVGKITVKISRIEP
ncbi:MAG TPA: hypothetical protein VE974_03955 [Thermoanaerobaculia bacterium]|nr:hypothetical protein [Thermoanaerobaculia bacterium]